MLFISCDELAHRIGPVKFFTFHGKTPKYMLNHNESHTKITTTEIADVNK